MSNLHQKYKHQAYEVELRSRTIRANAQFKVAEVVSGGERFLVNFGGGAIASSNFGGAVGIGDTVLNRNDSGQGWFYSNG